MAPTESLLWSLVRRKALGVRVHRQVVILGPYHARQRDQDAARDAAMEAAGLTVMRIDAGFVGRHPLKAIDQIKEVLNG
jgi:very-short-patch-repair endonuclease